MLESKAVEVELEAEDKRKVINTVKALRKSYSRIIEF